MEPVGLFVLLIAVALVFRLLAGGMDKDRIDDYVRERGGKVRSKSWAPFGKGWFGERNARIYEVEYEDKHGDVHRATVKTSMFAGVYLTEDRVVRRASEKPADRDEVSELERLRDENARLKAEITRRG
ncbi:MAG: hypothetical protein H6838_16050 [Planctomycetes bacterium]|nr:hypothetical protein [Planctomycetota bacterium]MCB9887005.1 hypothetical protein [Planctomycetota bacterium]